MYEIPPHNYSDLSLFELLAVENLLRLNADPTFKDWNGNDAIMYAIKKNNHEMLCTLLDISQMTIDLNRSFFVIM